ncbi:hypothetical protein RB595_004806 [Gaeumannomyces hyphopodioides]
MPSTAVTVQSPGLPPRSRPLTKRQQRLILLACMQAVSSIILSGRGRGSWDAAQCSIHNAYFAGQKLIDYWLRESAAHAFRDLFRITQQTFLNLCAWFGTRGLVRGTAHVSIAEKIAAFLFICGQGSSTRLAAHWLGHSTETTTRNFIEVLQACLHLHDEFVRPGRLPDVPGPERMRVGVRQAFQGCLGAIDGTQIEARLPANKAAVYRNRKGVVSQNVFAAVDHRGRFVFVMPGAEGSMHDSRLLRHAQKLGFQVPEGCFYLGDAGFFHGDGILMPYKGTRYHLQEQGLARPESREEIYNLYHAKMRAVVEDAFGVLKRRWKIVRGNAPEYCFPTQIDIVLPSLEKILLSDPLLGAR